MPGHTHNFVKSLIPGINWKIQGLKGIRTQPTLQDTSASYTMIEDQNK